MTFAKTSDCNRTFENYTSKAIKNHGLKINDVLVTDEKKILVPTDFKKKNYKNFIR